MTSTVGIKLDKEIKARLHLLGELRDRSPHWLMKHAITEYLDREEAREREFQEDRERWERYQLTGKHVTLDALDHWVDALPKI